MLAEDLTTFFRSASVKSENFGTLRLKCMEVLDEWGVKDCGDDSRLSACLEFLARVTVDEPRSCYQLYEGTDKHVFVGTKLLVSSSSQGESVSLY